MGNPATHNQPLVSIGIPTYNRAEGLARTLGFLTRQSYPHLEIIVSDNCSPDPEVQRVITAFAEKDSRIRNIRQTENIGMFRNFHFVLQQASGELYMWAADDDEWDENFIATCVRHLGNYSSVMTQFEVHNRSENSYTPGKLPRFAGDTYSDLFAHLKHMAPTLFYGLHRRESVLWVLDMNHFFDWFDVYLINRCICSGGFFVIPDYVGYRVGVDAKKYVVKPASLYEGQSLNYYDYNRLMMKLIFSNQQLSFGQKVSLAFRNLRSMLSLASHHEDVNRFVALRYLFRKPVPKSAA